LGRRLLPISVSLPSDDWGYEDDHIRATGDHWSVPIDWIEIDKIPLIADSERRARIRDDPMVQAFESMVRRLSKRSVELGSRVALDGFGGDHLFLVSGATVLADHLFHGRWSRLWEEWRIRVGGARQFVRDCVLPHLSPSSRRWIGSMRTRSRRLLGPVHSVDQLDTGDCGGTGEFERLPGEGAANSSSGMITNSVVRAVAGTTLWVWMGNPGRGRCLTSASCHSRQRPLTTAAAR
jgi:hypothetical protein